LNLDLFTTLAAVTENRGEVADMAAYLRDPNTFGSQLKFAFKRMGAAVRGLINFTFGGLLGSKRYYKFEPNTLVYMQFLNEMLIEVAAWMELAEVPNKDNDIEKWENNSKSEAEIEKDLEKPYDSGMKKDEGTGLVSTPYRGLSKSLSVLNILPGWKTKNIIHRQNNTNESNSKTSGALSFTTEALFFFYKILNIKKNNHMKICTKLTNNVIH
jgi:hypothetical protein